MLVKGGGPSGDCPSLERRRERRGAAGCESEASAGSAASFSGPGSGTADVSQV